MSYPPTQVVGAEIPSLMSIKTTRDDCWLQVQVCREFLRGECIRGAAHCKFAHPPPALQYVSGRVKVCFDHLKKKCARSECKFFHTPQHLSQEVLRAGKDRVERKKAAQELVPLPPHPQLAPYQHLLPLYNPYSSALIEQAIALTGQPLLLPMPVAPALNAFCFPPPPLAPLVPTPPGVITRRRPAGSDDSDATPPKRPTPEVAAVPSPIPPIVAQQYMANSFMGQQFLGYQYLQMDSQNQGYIVGNPAPPPPGFGFNWGQF